MSDLHGALVDRRHILDENRDGIVSAYELHSVLKTALKTRTDMSDAQIRNIIDALDKDGDGRIDLTELSILKEKLQVRVFCCV